MDMKRMEAILNHKLFQDTLHQIEEKEVHREFCRHGMPHLLDTARIAYITCLENGLPLEKDIVYATALLHDLGRARQDEEGYDHRLGGLPIIEEILKDSGFDDSEIQEIKKAVASHGQKPQDSDQSLSAVLYRADKQSRNCFWCPAALQCYWPENQRNMSIKS